MYNISYTAVLYHCIMQTHISVFLLTQSLDTLDPSDLRPFFYYWIPLVLHSENPEEYYLIQF